MPTHLTVPIYVANSDGSRRPKHITRYTIQDEGTNLCALRDFAAASLDDCGIELPENLLSRLLVLDDPLFSPPAIPMLKDLPHELPDDQRLGWDEWTFSSIRIHEKEGSVVILYESGKRRAEQMADLSEFQQAKKAKLISKSPSEMSKPLNYEAIQKSPSERILDDRPTADEGLPPVPLLYSGFGHFLDIYNGCNDFSELSILDLPRLQVAVEGFAEAMSAFFTDEDARPDAGLPFLNEIFSSRKSQLPSFAHLHAQSFRSLRTDEHNIAAYNAAGTVVVFKNMLTGNRSIPEVEVACYVAQLNARSKEVSTLFDRWRMPYLGITVVEIGHQVTFYAVISVGHQYRLVSLTPTLSCLVASANSDDRKRLRRAFAAALVLDMLIFADICRLLKQLPPTIHPDRWRLPAVTQLRKYPLSESSAENPSDVHLDFQIEHDQRSNPSRLIYIAVSEGQEIVIKFTRSYCPRLHTFCAELGHAPNLLAYERLPGGWFGVAMAYIPFARHLSDCKADAAERLRWGNQLSEVMNRFHEAGLVHGDLRDSNIVVDGEGRVLLLDFDWGGLDGEATYPTWSLNPQLLEGRTRHDFIIRKEDDKRILEYTLSLTSDDR
ncbi:unnamed protein product [Cyclocybe aegerita]|uniref:Uncharacterized protein n=1 Tax=Cyclocybe aegerita TaxID=1973307 RepID=A0A8S0W003_CYCAE|nr:unnamed protein product [Cyclocybe aegerita]